MSTLLDHKTHNMTDLNDEVRSDRYYFKNLPDVPKLTLLRLPYWIANAEDGGYNLYYWDQSGDYRVRHFNVINAGTNILNNSAEPFDSLQAFVSNSQTHCYYGEKMGTDRLPSL